METANDVFEGATVRPSVNAGTGPSRSGFRATFCPSLFSWGGVTVSPECLRNNLRPFPVSEAWVVAALFRCGSARRALSPPDALSVALPAERIAVP
jgi:hypothetical protein